MKPNKTQQVLEYLKNNKGGITSWDAIQMFRATRLSAIIYNLEKKGYVFAHCDEKGDGVRYTRYFLQHSPKV